MSKLSSSFFYELAMERGADYIATGHYARVGSNLEGDFKKNDNTLSEPQFLLRAKDENKDQTYFLYRMSDQATAKTIFPVGNYTKPEIKQLATNHGLDVANKKESIGVCFAGEVGMKDFLFASIPILALVKSANSKLIRFLVIMMALFSIQ